MSETKDQKSAAKSNVKVLPTPPANEKRKAKDIHFNIARAMAGEDYWPAFPIKLHRWVDHMGVSVPYAESKDGIVKKVADDAIHAYIAYYWRHTLNNEDRPILLGTLSAADCDKTRRLWLAIAKARRDKFLTLGWASTEGPAHHKVPFDPVPAGETPLFDELMARTSNHRTLMAWLGSLFDPKSQRQQYAWLYGTGGNGKSAMVRVLMNLLGPVAASESPPTRDAKHWTVSLSSKRLVVFPDCNNVAFVTSGDFKQLTGEDPIRMEPKGKPVYYENIDAKFLIISNDRPRISSSKADLRRVLFFSVGELQEAARVPNYEEQLAAEAPAFISACWKMYQDATGGNPRHEFVANDLTEVQAVVEDTEHEMESFVDGYLIPSVFSDSVPKENQAYVKAERMKDLMIRSGFRTEYDRKKLRDYMARKYNIVRKKIRLRLSEKQTEVRLVYVNCRDRDLTQTHLEASPE